MSDAPELDIRWPIGLLFAVMGALVSGYGLLHSGEAHPEASGPRQPGATVSGPE